MDFAFGTVWYHNHGRLTDSKTQSQVSQTRPLQAGVGKLFERAMSQDNVVHKVQGERKLDIFICHLLVQKKGLLVSPRGLVVLVHSLVVHIS